MSSSATTAAAKPAAAKPVAAKSALTLGTATGTPSAVPGKTDNFWTPQRIRAAMIGVIVLIAGTMIGYVVYQLMKNWPLVAALGAAGIALALGGPELLAGLLTLPLTLAIAIGAKWKDIKNKLFGDDLDAAAKDLKDFYDNSKKEWPSDLDANAEYEFRVKYSDGTTGTLEGSFKGDEVNNLTEEQVNGLTGQMAGKTPTEMYPEPVVA